MGTNIIPKHKAITLSFILLFSIGSVYSPIMNCTDTDSISNIAYSDLLCYGFLIPLPSSDAIEANPEIQLSLLNLINDLLRLEVPVYWTTSAITVSTKPIHIGSAPEPRSFEAGTFLIPLTNRSSLDAKIVAVVGDYNGTHELDSHTQAIEIVMVSEPLILEQAYHLHEPNTAYYYGEGVYSNSLNWYVSTLYNAGFLTNRFLSDDEVIQALNTNDFNVFIWPGGDILRDITSNVNIWTRIHKLNAIKHFVNLGGGYIGSCYGAFAACSGTRFFPLPLLSNHGFLLPTVGFLSIQDTFTALALSSSINVTVSDIDHPVLYGVSGTITNSQLRGGPVYTWLGKNTQSLGTIKDVNSTIWAYWFRELYGSNTSYAKKIIDLWARFTTGKTVWTTSTYGNGKVVTFGDHPEVGAITQKRLIYNALFYTTSTMTSQILLDVPLPISTIETMAQKSENLTIPNTPSNEFPELYDSINETLADFQTFQFESESIFNKTWSLIENHTMNVSLGIDIFVSGMWEFRGTMGRSIHYLMNGSEDENVQSFLKKLDGIYYALRSKNLTINDSIDTFIISEQQRLDEIRNINTNISVALTSLNTLLDCYSGSQTQNDSLLTITHSLWENSKLLEKNCPLIFFDSLKLLRDAWYLYETLYEP